MTDSQPFRVGVVGSSPQGRDLLERLSLQPRCELLWYPAENHAPLVPGLKFIDDWHRFLSDSELQAVLFLDGRALDPAQLQASLEADLFAGVLPPLAGGASRWSELASAPPDRLRVLSPHDENADFQAARAWVQSGEGGPIRAIKRLSWVSGLIESAPPDPASDVWFSQWLWEDVDQLLCLAGTLPERVYAAEFSPDGQRYFLVFQFAGGLAAHLERRRFSVVPLELGWTLTGAAGGYANGERSIQTEAGEIYNVPAERPAREDDSWPAPLAPLAQAVGPVSTWSHALNVLRVQDAIQQSARSGNVTCISGTRKQ